MSLCEFWLSKFTLQLEWGREYHSSFLSAFRCPWTQQGCIPSGWLIWKEFSYPQSLSQWVCQLEMAQKMIQKISVWMLKQGECSTNQVNKIFCPSHVQLFYQSPWTILIFRGLATISKNNFAIRFKVIHLMSNCLSKSLDNFDFQKDQQLSLRITLL